MKAALARWNSVWVFLWSPGAWACAVCTDPNDMARASFILTTLLLTGLPLVFIGGGVWWLRRRSAALEAQVE